MLARNQPTFAGRDASLAQFALGKMHAGQIAAIVRERYQRVLIADISQVDSQAFFAEKQLSQLRNGEAVACVNTDDGGAEREKLVDLGFQFLGKVLELRSQTRLQTLARPDQLVAKRGQFRAT